ncbi:MAG: hypothetical protein IGS48_01320 [Oscillatoriales cyanobacterium C42_A2020_001]|nr:hypothetical protein [Leptolyngbyaceae cyanobacterium C42_A2020_001]
MCKTHYAEFAGPGAAICNPFEYEYGKIIAIGSPEIVEVATHEDRQKAYSRRIQWVRWLHKIVSEQDADHRAENLFAGFEEFFGGNILVGIPTDALALLAGVLPQTIANVRSQHPACVKGDSANLGETDVEIYLISSSSTASPLAEPAISSPIYPNFSEVRVALPCSA